MGSKYDFSGYATKNDLKCSDGRVIRRDAFKDNDGSVVPLVWQHLHDSPANILGHALLENRSDGVYAYCSFNDSAEAEDAKIRVKHGDVSSMSIYANRLVQNGHDVVHGVIREVSLVLAGANPGARIENIALEHSDGTFSAASDEACIYTDSPLNIVPGEVVAHSSGDFNSQEVNEMDEEALKKFIDDYLSHADDEENQNGSGNGKERTVQDVIDGMTDEQKQVLYFLVGVAAEDEDDEAAQDGLDEGEDFSMKHNVFDSADTDTTSEDQELVHSEVLEAIADARKYGSMKASFEAHEISVDALQHSVENLDVLFPEAKLVTPTPEMIARPTQWVSEVWGALKKSPFARIKSTAADVTADEARAKGYVKGAKKVEEVVKLLRRVTTPQTVYKLQKMDRDDIIDITDIDIIAWLKAEMRMMLDEELARAVMVGDQREEGSPDKIKTDNIRPIYGDNSTYTIYEEVEKDSYEAMDETEKSNYLIDRLLRARKNYMGSGNPAMYASTDFINDMLLAKDKIGRRLYSTVSELADALRVSKIVEVPVMEGVQRKYTNSDDAQGPHYQGGEQTCDLLCLIVNLGDYTVGADRGGAVTMFDDFDIDYNKYEYLIETRCSGALTKPYSAIALELNVTEAV